MPEAFAGWQIYYSDGASRRQPGGDHQASYGVALQRDNRLTFELAVYIGDFTNNDAEYRGVLAAIDHARHNDTGHNILFRVDSLLVARQLQGAWGCHASSLKPWYERALTSMRLLREIRVDREVLVEHIYREYNCLADSLANVAIEQRTNDIAPQTVLDRTW